MAKGMLRINKRQRQRLARESKRWAVIAYRFVYVVMLVTYGSGGFDGEYRYNFLMDSLAFGLLTAIGLASYWIASAYTNMLLRKDAVYANTLKIFIKDLLSAFIVLQILLPPAVYILREEMSLEEFGAIIYACFGVAIVSAIMLALFMACINLHKYIRVVGRPLFSAVLGCSLLACILMVWHVILDIRSDYGMVGPFVACLGLSVFAVFMLWMVEHLGKDADKVFMIKTPLLIGRGKTKRLARDVRKWALRMLWVPFMVVALVYLGGMIDGRWSGYFVDILVLAFMGWGILVLYYASSVYVEMLLRKGDIYGNIIKIFAKDFLCPFFAVMILVPPVLYMVMGDSPLADFGAIASVCFDISLVASLVLALAVASVNLYKTHEEVGPFTFFIILSCAWFMPAMLCQYVIFDVPFDLGVDDLFTRCLALSVLVIFMMWLDGGLEKNGKLIIWMDM